MTNIRVTCRCCGFVVLIRPAQVLLLAEPDETSGAYLFVCPVCGRLIDRSAQPGEVQQLVASGVRAAGATGESTGSLPAARGHARPLFTPDDLLDFHLLLADDEWFPRLAESVRPPLSG